MSGRALLASLLGAIAMFLWASLAHTVLPLGEVGIHEIPHEAPVLDALHASIGAAAGLYFFPGMGLAPNASRSERSAAMSHYAEKLAASPSGILVYHPPGAQGLSPARLAIEFATELLETLLAVLLLGMTRLASYGSRVGFVTLIGLLAVLGTNVSYWNWYDFPGNYTAAYMTSQLVGFFVAGLVVAAVLRRGGPAPA
jgi:hypothetical protein